MTTFPMIKMPELFVEPALSFESNGDDLRRLSLSTSVQDEIGTSTVTVIPGGFDEESSSVDVACLGDGSATFFLTRRVFRGNETEVGHESSGRREAMDVIDFQEQSECSQGASKEFEFSTSVPWLSPQRIAAVIDSACTSRPT
jgi:hypothetical protein